MVTKRKSAGRSGALSVEDWVQAAYSAIAEGGVAAVAVEPLARKLGVTRGSFYWHFKDRDSLLEATLKKWEQEATEAVIATSRQVADPRERLIRLAEEVFCESLQRTQFGRGIFRAAAFELAISDAADNPIVGPVLQRVTNRRIDYLEECYRALGLSPQGEARYRALLIYATYAGTLRLVRETPDRLPRGEDCRTYLHHLVSTLIPESSTARD